MSLFPELAWLTKMQSDIAKRIQTTQLQSNDIIYRRHVDAANEYIYNEDKSVLKLNVDCKLIILSFHLYS